MAREPDLREERDQLAARVAFAERRMDEMVDLIVDLAGAFLLPEKHRLQVLQKAKQALKSWQPQ